MPGYLSLFYESIQIVSAFSEETSAIFNTKILADTSPSSSFEPQLSPVGGVSLRWAYL